MLQTIPGHRVLVIGLCLHSTGDKPSKHLGQGGDGSVCQGEGGELEDRRERVGSHLPDTSIRISISIRIKIGIKDHQK